MIELRAMATVSAWAIVLLAPFLGGVIVGLRWASAGRFRWEEGYREGWAAHCDVDAEDDGDDLGWRPGGRAFPGPGPGRRVDP